MSSSMSSSMSMGAGGPPPEPQGSNRSDHQKARWADQVDDEVPEPRTNAATGTDAPTGTNAATGTNAGTGTVSTGTNAATAGASVRPRRRRRRRKQKQRGAAAAAEMQLPDTECEDVDGNIDNPPPPGESHVQERTVTTTRVEQKPSRTLTRQQLWPGMQPNYCPAEWQWQMDTLNVGGFWPFTQPCRFGEWTQTLEWQVVQALLRIPCAKIFGRTFDVEGLWKAVLALKKNRHKKAYKDFDLLMESTPADFAKFRRDDTLVLNFEFCDDNGQALSRVLQLLILLADAKEILDMKEHLVTNITHHCKKCLNRNGHHALSLALMLAEREDQIQPLLNQADNLCSRNKYWCLRVMSSVPANLLAKTVFPKKFLKIMPNNTCDLLRDNNTMRVVEKIAEAGQHVSGHVSGDVCDGYLKLFQKLSSDQLRGVVVDDRSVEALTYLLSNDKCNRELVSDMKEKLRDCCLQELKTMADCSVPPTGALGDIDIVPVQKGISAPLKKKAEKLLEIIEQV